MSRRHGATGRRSPASWRSRAFGIDLESPFELPTLPPATGPPATPPTKLELVPIAALEAGWSQGGATRVDELRRHNGRLAIAIDHHPRFGYRLEAPGFGRYRVSSDGLRVSCAPRRLATWRRDRFLTARVLPLAALLRGLELLHASAVAFDGSTVAIAGPSHSGKTSLAIRLVLEGARFVTDDVLALEAFDGKVIAHPGAAVAGVRHAEHLLLTADDQTRLGRSSDRGDKVWASLSREERPLPLRLLYFIRRGSKADRTAIDEVPRLDPRMLLGSSFLNGVVRTPERLTRQLDRCAQLSRAVAIFTVGIPPRVSASAAAREVAMHAGAVLDRRAASAAAPSRRAAGAPVAGTKADIKA